MIIFSSQTGGIPKVNVYPEEVSFVNEITWLGKQLGCSRQNIYKILNRPWIYTDMLLKISDLLDYDFFKCFCYKFR